MIPNITRGGDMRGVLAYLLGPGREGADVHVEPHLVAGSPAAMAWWGANELEVRDAAAIARELDGPRRAFGVEVTRPVKDDAGHVVGRAPAHVWHCSLALRPEEDALSDERWARIAEEFVAMMGFDTGRGGECRWVAVHHGRSRGRGGGERQDGEARGSDHIHVVVGLVRENGEKADVHHDFGRAQRACGELERRHGLVALESRAAGLGSRGVHPEEAQADARRGRDEPARLTLERTVRACAAAAGDELEFVAGLRAAGVRVRPRYATGRGDEVAGYSVGLAPRPGEPVIWFGGGKLARDLTLPRLRCAWPPGTVPTRDLAAAWQGTQRVAPDGDRAAPPALNADALAAASDTVGRLAETLARVPVDDRAAWARAAGQAAGVCAAWSARVEATPGPLAAAVRSLARSAEIPAWQARTQRTALPSTRGTALLLSAAADPANRALGWATLLRQVARVAEALSAVHAAAGDAQRAAELAQLARAQRVTAGSARPLGERVAAEVDAASAEAARLAATGLPAREARPPAAAPTTRPPRAPTPAERPPLGRHASRPPTPIVRRSARR